jgi:uncharacterized membrane protein YfcA
VSPLQKGSRGSDCWIKHPHPMPVTLSIFFIMTAAVAFLIGLAKGGFGGMMGALATPMMALIMPADRVLGIVLPILMFADIFAVSMYWRRWNLRLVLLLIPGALAGVTIGTLFITNAPTQTLRLGLGVIVLVLTVYKIFEPRILPHLRYQPHRWHGLLAGTVTGFSSTLAHSGGPPVGIYLLLQHVTPQVFIATSAIFFFLLNWIKVPYYMYAHLFDLQALVQIVWLMPLVPLGVWIGKRFGDRVSKQVFDRIIVVLLAISALLLIVT